MANSRIASPPREFSDDILRMILPNTPIPDMASMRAAARVFAPVVDRFLEAKLRRLLQPYLDNVLAFHDLLRSTQTIICGSHALDFIWHGTNAPALYPADLDLLTDPLHAITILTHLRDVEGYHILPCKRPPERHLIVHSRRGLVSFTRLAHPAKGRIDVGCSVRLAASHPLAYCPNTLMMNYLTADGLAVAYPTLSFDLRGLRNRLVPWDEDAVEGRKKLVKWSDRLDILSFRWNTWAISFKEEVSHPAYYSKLCHDDGHERPVVLANCPSVCRSFDDGYTFRLCFSAEKHTPLVPRAPATTWVIGGSECGAGCKKSSLGCVSPDAEATFEAGQGNPYV